jgi:hypothetical protein
MSDKGKRDELLFTLRAPLSEEDVRAYEEARRKVAAQVFVALAPGVGGVAAMYEHAAEAIARAAVLRLNVPDFSRVVLAVAQVAEESARMGSLIASAIAGVYEQTCESVRIFGETVAAMTEDEREELRRAFEDAPLEPVDVDAEGLM